MEHLCSAEPTGTDEKDVPKPGLILLIAELQLLEDILQSNSRYLNLQTHVRGGEVSCSSVLVSRSEWLIFSAATLQASFKQKDVAIESLACRRTLTCPASAADACSP